MIPHASFHKLRLADFLSHPKLVQLRDWEFMERVWIGEALGFSEWLRLKSEPTKLRSLAIDFGEFPVKTAAHILRVLDLPLRPAMNYVELSNILGPPVQIRKFVQDRSSYEFHISEPSKYDISCTVLHNGGLVYLVVMDSTYSAPL